MKYLLTQEELDALGPISETKKWKDAAMELSKMLSAVVPRADGHGNGGIGGKGCILEAGAESEYCYGCPSEKLCPYEYKQWPK